MSPGGPFRGAFRPGCFNRLRARWPVPHIARTALPKALYSLIPDTESSITTQRSSRILVFERKAAVPAVELRSLVLPQVSPHLSIRRPAVSAGDQHRLMVGPSVRHRVRSHGSAADHAGNFLLGFPEGAGNHISLNVLAYICPAKVTEVLFHKSPLISYVILPVQEKKEKNLEVTFGQAPDAVLGYWCPNISLL